MQQYEPTSLLDLPRPDEHAPVSSMTHAAAGLTGLATFTAASRLDPMLAGPEVPSEGLPIMWDEDEDEDEDDDDLLGDDDDELEFDDDEEAIEEEEKEAVEGDDEEFDFDEDDEEEEEP